MSNLISLEKYSVIFKSPSFNNLDNAEIICLVQTYEDEEEQQAIARFIDAYQSVNSLVLTKFIPFLNQINKEATLQTCYLKSAIPIYGWDIGEYEIIFELDPEQAEIVGKIRTFKLAIKAESDILFNFNATSMQKNQAFNYLESLEDEMNKAKKAFSTLCSYQIKNHQMILDKVHQQRNKSMISAISTLSEVTRPIFVLAEKRHFENRFENQELFNFLSQKKAVVIESIPYSG